MFRKLFILALALGKLSAADPPHEIRILTWNLHHGVGEDDKLDLKRIAAVIQAQKPDLVALQEVDKNCRRSGNVDQTAELAKLTGMHGTFGKAMDLGEGEYGQAILSKTEIKQTQIHRLPGEGEPRIAFEATQSIDGKPLRFVTAHLSFESDAGRSKQIEALISALSAHEMPTVLAGDFNDVPGSAAMKLLSPKWQAVAKNGPGLTHPAKEPTTEIDHIFLQGFEAKGKAEILPEAVASDHRPVMAVVSRTP